MMTEINKEQIRNNLSEIQQKIDQAAAKSGRKSSKISLMAVTKKKSAEMIRCLIDLNIQYFGENYPDETLEKIEAFKETEHAIRLCMIGHLQSRKINIVAEHFDEYHSLDRLKTAVRLNQILKMINKTMPVFLEINIGNEDSKSGWSSENGNLSDQLLKDLEVIRTLSQLKVDGLMALPPISENPEESRPYFVRLRYMLEKLNDNYGYSLHHLSMGTSIDYPIAIEEGATFVRIGTALTGPRI